MKVTVAHLYKKLDELDRDVVELKKLTDRLATDREYSPILKETFLSEMAKLEDQKSEILGLRVEKLGSTLKPPKSKPNQEDSKPLERVKEEVTLSLPQEPKKTERPVRKY
ncbi:hypothetical protein EHQ92_11870 [Leptospira biflexa]|uniref:hypothetical protein n=1 Tax=Leptospira biflexa TaxID=172 RepID=UPI00108463AB|nr:hypothetical protein [Leptospira biflexa]TGM38973.1 hypothetical protein EHQ89_07870 [Leptospira biflexa]TGM39875.1 hypothetical protein EHQ80_01355 [Leptospira biflexa]TGM48534.1 hypothetical protein EHQ92_11870 [Leptospira biflexa]TGM49001.1 hypothetical protein EHQ88_01205 [Leptospira biflexa]TGM54272.1 hypothetical protein EHQ91_04560 [Leptospira biflexa]